jgi:uncharacterized protein YdeI (YjbR/CyaY-like superfamily)
MTLGAGVRFRFEDKAVWSGATGTRSIRAVRICFFKSPAAFRAWLERHHLSRRELHVGFWKRHTARPSLTWAEAVDEALCFGWIDGVRHRLDHARYTIRFTPRKPSSTWSTVNLKRIRALIKSSRVRARGLKLFRERDRKKSGLYSFEQRRAITLAPRHAKLLRADRAAWAYFQAQAPWFRRTAAFWVESAKQEETRLRRLGALIAASAAGRSDAPLTRK